MIWVATAVTFLATVFVLMAVLYALSSGEQLIAQRLTRLWHPPASTEKVRLREKQKQWVQNVLTDVGKLVPASTKKLPHTQRLMVRAGYRRPEAVTAMRGAKVLLPVAGVALVYLTGVYRHNPLFLLVFAGVVGFLLPEIWLTWRIRRRQRRIRLALPDALDLLVVCVEAGLGLDQAILRVSEELRIVHPQLSEEMQLVNLEMRLGKNRLDALRELAARTGVDDVKALVAMLIQTDRFGTSVAQSLRVHSDDLRTKRRQRAEEMAAKTTIKMIPPLVFFIFPALFVVILGPAVISVARKLLPAVNR
jgi:tight adherence protein C